MGIFSTREKGNASEEVAARHLLRQGYAVLERNFLCRAGEIDIVAREGEALVFVEVRSRAADAFMDPVVSVNPAKMTKLVRAAENYRLVREVPPSTSCRFDVVGIIGGGAGARIVLVRNAFTLDDLPRPGPGRRSRQGRR